MLGCDGSVSDGWGMTCGSCGRARLTLQDAAALQRLAPRRCVAAPAGLTPAARCPHPGIPTQARACVHPLPFFVSEEAAAEGLSIRAQLDAAAADAASFSVPVKVCGVTLGLQQCVAGSRGEEVASSSTVRWKRELSAAARGTRTASPVGHAAACTGALTAVPTARRPCLPLPASLLQALLVTNPNNPQGTLYSDETILQMLRWCLDNRVHYVRWVGGGQGRESVLWGASR